MVTGKSGDIYLNTRLILIFVTFFYNILKFGTLMITRKIIESYVIS